MVTFSEIIADIKTYAKKHGNEKTVMEFEQDIIDSTIPYLNYAFVRYIKGANVKKHGQAIIDSGDLFINYLYPRDIKGADIKGHEQLILDNGTFTDHYFFAKDIKGANVQLLEQKVLESDNLFYIIAFANNVKGANVDLLVNRALKLIDSYCDAALDSDSLLVNCDLNNLEKLKKELSKKQTEFRKNIKPHQKAKKHPNRNIILH